MGLERPVFGHQSRNLTTSLERFIKKHSRLFLSGFNILCGFWTNLDFERPVFRHLLYIKTIFVLSCVLIEIPFY